MKLLYKIYEKEDKMQKGKKESNLVIFLIITVITLSGCVSTQEEEINTEEIGLEEIIAEHTPVPTSESTSTLEKKIYEKGDCWLIPLTTDIAIDANFVSEVHVNTLDQKIAAYGFDITYDPDLLKVNSSKGDNGIEPGVDGFVVAVNISIPGIIKIAGFEVTGKGPGTDLHIITIHWISIMKGSTILNLKVRDLRDENTDIIGIPRGARSLVEIK